MKSFFYVGYVLVAFFIHDAYSVRVVRALSRTVYHYPKLDDECIDECKVGGYCRTVRYKILKCSERFKSWTGKTCLGACSWRIGLKVYTCRVSDNDFEECSLTKKRERVQHWVRFLNGKKGCVSSCRKYSEKYYWCRTGLREWEWDYCSKTQGFSIYDNQCAGLGCEYRSYYAEAATCTTVQGNTEDCAAVKDHTVTSQIEYHYIGNKLHAVNLQYDARELVDGQPIDKFIVVNITEPEIIITDQGSHDRKKRYVCRTGCNPQTLSDTLTNLADEYEHHHVTNTNGIRRINPPWAPFANDSDIHNRNPIVRAYVRDIGPGVSRVEFVEAQIHLNHYNPDNRVDITQTDKNFMRSQPGVISDHEAGHIVASVLGGPPDRYNFVPQHSAVNRNSQSRETASGYENDWYSVEQLMPQFFINGQPGTQGGYIIWRVAIHYNSDTDYVPYMFQYLARFYNSDGVEYDDGDWFPAGGATFNRQYHGHR